MIKATEYSILDALYEDYGFKSVNLDGVKAYEYKHGRYFGVDVIDDGGPNVQRILEDYARQHYSTARKKYDNIEAAEDDLYKGFFQIEYRRNEAQKKYESFKNSQLRGLSEGAESHDGQRRHPDPQREPSGQGRVFRYRI